MKKFFLDLETTGTIVGIDDITQLACIVEIDGEEKERYKGTACPRNPDITHKKAFKAHGIDAKTMRTYPPAINLLRDVYKIVSKYVTEEDPAVFQVWGQNANFDKEHMFALFKRLGYEHLFYKTFEHKVVDLLAITPLLQSKGLLPVTKINLDEMCRIFNIKRDKAHDALDDIAATKQIFDTISKLFIRDIKEVDLSLLQPESELYAFLSSK